MLQAGLVRGCSQTGPVQATVYELGSYEPHQGLGMVHAEPPIHSSGREPFLIYFLDFRYFLQFYFIFNFLKFTPLLPGRIGNDPS